MTEAGGTRRKKWLVVAALVAGVLSVLTVVLALAAPRRSIPPAETNLSDDKTLDSYLADVAVSTDGDRVAVVWVEEISNGVPSHGSVWLRWASESGENGWSPRVPVFTGTEQALANWSASVALTGTTAHVAYVIFTGTTQTGIFYSTCSLPEGRCAAQTITSALFTLNPSEQQYFSGVDIALDNNGNPHFAYRRIWEGTEEEKASTVYYYDKELLLEERVPGSEAGKFANWSSTSGFPAIAWSDQFAHVVWEEQTVGGGNLEIRHNRKNIISGTWESDRNISTYGNLTFHPHNPDIAAYKDHVIVTWDWKWRESDQYVLAYTRYLTDENSWMPVYEVGTQGAADYLIDDGTPREPPYHTYFSTDASNSPFQQYLQPSITLDKEGLPAIVWHANNGFYEIMYSRAQSMTESLRGDMIFSWSEPGVLYWPSTKESVSPVAVQAPVVSPTLHVIFAQNQGGAEEDQETYYVGREAGYTLSNLSDIFLPLVLRQYYGGPE
ncbi:MAG: hypothetical protein GY832_27995 [Chloroflexi bacterium]|nr:hypothetical protein [Chloroflexota bacterium]